jgi:putative inorganic carbon (hco3(-)) transporter
MAFLLFLLVNAALFIRPGEIVPAMLGWEIYFYVILACLLVAAPDVLRYLTGQSLGAQPITLCVFGLLAAIMLAGFVAAGIDEAWRTGFHFAKVVIYYILFVSLVTTPPRLRTLLLCILVCAGAVTTLAVLGYHEIIHIDTIEALDDSVSGMWGETTGIRRLQGTGIFQDPNELCVLLSAMLPLCLYFLFTDRNIVLRVFCVALVPLFAYAVYLTQSRGGFISFVGGLAVLAWMRFGWRRTALIGVVGLPLLLILFGGRQTEISTQTGTAQTRVELWRDWMMTFRENPVFGKGMSLPKEDELKNRRPDEEKRHHAHNSFLQGFADLGFFGGCLLVGAYFVALWSLYRYNADDSLLLNRDLKTLQPYLVAGIAAYTLGMMTLTICYIVPTFMMLAIAVAFTQMARRSALAAPAPLRLDLPLIGRIATAGLCVLAGIYVFVRFLA